MNNNFRSINPQYENESIKKVVEEYLKKPLFCLITDKDLDGGNKVVLAHDYLAMICTSPINQENGKTKIYHLCSCVFPKTKLDTFDIYDKIKETRIVFLHMSKEDYMKEIVKDEQYSIYYKLKPTQEVLQMWINFYSLPENNNQKIKITIDPYQKDGRYYIITGENLTTDVYIEIDDFNDTPNISPNYDEKVKIKVKEDESSTDGFPKRCYLSYKKTIRPE